MPSGKPGKFSTSVVRVSWPPVGPPSMTPSISEGFEVGAGGVDGSGQPGGAGADDDDVVDAVGDVHSRCLTGARRAEWCSAMGARRVTASPPRTFPRAARPAAHVVGTPPRPVPSTGHGSPHLPPPPHAETYLRCSVCETPICPDCWVEAAVGYQCPDCAGQRAEAAAAASASTGRPAPKASSGGGRLQARATTASEGRLPASLAFRAVGAGIGASILGGFVLGPVLAQGLFFLISAGAVGWGAAHAVFFGTGGVTSPFVRAVALTCGALTVGGRDGQPGHLGSGRRRPRRGRLPRLPGGRLRRVDHGPQPPRVTRRDALRDATRGPAGRAQPCWKNSTSQPSRPTTHTSGRVAAPVPGATPSSCRRSPAARRR